MGKNPGVRLYLKIFLLGCVFAIVGAQSAIGQIEGVEHVVLIGVDALSPDGIQNADTPNLDELMRLGASTMDARNVRPTSSSQNWGSMLMGARPEHHGITSNGWQPNNHSISPQAVAYDGRFPSIFALVREQRPDAYTAAIYDWNGMGRLLERNVIDLATSPDGAERTASRAAQVIQNEKPLFTFVHLDHADAAGHGSGHGSPEYYAAVSLADRYIGQVLAALDAAEIRSKTVVIVTADHGGRSGGGHGGDSLGERQIPWIMQGPGVDKDVQVNKPVNVYDTAATAAFVLGLEMPSAWMGRPVYQAFDPPLAPRPIPFPAIDSLQSALIIGIDGLTPAGLSSATTPHLDQLIETGVSTLEARSVLPTSDSPAWASMLMGAPPEHHGVTSDSWQRNNFQIEPQALSHGDIFPTFLGVIRDEEPQAYLASIFDWSGFGRMIELNILDRAATTLRAVDAVNIVSEIYQQENPRSVALQINSVVETARQSGFGSSAYLDAIEEADALIGGLLASLEADGKRSKTLVLVTSDHGGTGSEHGGDSMDELEIPWILNGPGIKEGHVLEDPVTIYDTAPTVLFALGIAPPDVWVGRPIYEAFAALVTSTDENSLPSDLGFSLSPNYPNPFSELTRIEYTLPETASIRLAVFDVLGQEVAVLAEGSRADGSHSLQWSGRDKFGRALATGVYFYRLTSASGISLTRTIQLTNRNR